MKLILLMLAISFFLSAQSQTTKTIAYKTISHIGNKRIVALGEDTHGTSEFYKIRAAITKKLIREKKFTIFMLENPHEDMLQLQRDLQTVSLDTLMRRHLFPIYQTKEMKVFLMWFKKYSRKNPELKMAGCDDSYRDILPAMMIQETQTFKHPLLQQLCKEFVQMQLNGGADDMKFGLDTYLFLNKIDSVYKGQGMRSEMMEQLIFHAKTAYVFYYKYSRKEPVSRDEIMGERIAYHAGSDKKMIVWAHNGHIAKYAWLDNELGLMGATVLKKFPGDYISIGMSSANGKYSYIDNRFINGDHVFNDTLHTATFRPIKDSSLNAILAGYAAPNLILSAQQLPDAIHPVRIQGYRKEGENYNQFYSANPAKLFDVLIFLRETKATEGLFK